MKRLIRCLILFSPLLLIVVSLSFGEKFISPAMLLRSLFGHAQPEDKAIIHLLVSIRLPQTLQAFLCGGLLAVSGAAMQAVLRNPLAEPYVLGVSSGSAFGLVGSSLLGVSGLFWYQFGAAFIGGILAVTIVLIGSLRRRQPLSMVRIILLGVAVNAFFSALTMLMQSFLDPYQFSASVGLLMGEISLQGSAEIGTAAIIGIPSLVFLILRAPEMDILSQGRDGALTLGLSVDREMILALLWATFAAAVSVAMCGIIGFVGLAAPHIVRSLWGSSHRKLFPLSFLVGGRISSDSSFSQPSYFSRQRASSDGCHSTCRCSFVFLDYPMSRGYACLNYVRCQWFRVGFHLVH